MQGPRLYRFFNYEQIHYLPAPTAGWNPDANPWELPDDQAAVLDNFLLRPGKITVRGGFRVVGDLTASSPLDVSGYCASSGQVFISRKDATKGAVDPWNAPLLGASSTVLASGLTGMMYVSATGVVTNVTAANADQIIGPRWINFDGLLYGISYDTAGAAVQDASASYFAKPCSLLTLPRGTFSGNQTLAGGVYSSDPTNGSPAPWTGTPNQVTLTAAQTSQYLEVNNMGFVIPTSATILGIAVTVNKRDAGTGSHFKDVVVQLMKAGGLVGTNNADTSTFWPNTTFPASYGGASNLWGTTWTAADINNGNFGLEVSAKNFSGAPAVAEISSVSFTIYYTVTTATPLPTVLLNAPHGAVDVKGYQSRVWLLGGVDTPGSGTTHSATTIFFTIPGAAGVGGTLADWRDPVSGLTNQIKMDNDSSDFGVALALVRGGLLVLRRSSIWLVRGSTTSTYSVQPVSREAGCVDPRSVVETDHGVYFMSRKGLMLTDGVRVTNVSGACLYTIQEAIALEQQSVIGGLGGYITCALTTQGQIIVSIGKTVASGHIAPLWCASYDPSIKGGAWIRLTSQVWSGDGTQVGTNYYPGQLISWQSPHMLYAVGDKYVTQLEDTGQNYSFLLQSQLYDQLPSGGSPFLSVPAVWKTKFAPIAGTTLRKGGIAKRFFIDYVFAGSGIVPATGWAVVPVNASDSAYNTTLSAALGSTPQGGSVSGISLNASPSIQRQNIDFLNELDDLGFDITWADSARASQPSNAVAELYGIGIEWQKSRDRR